MLRGEIITIQTIVVVLAVFISFLNQFIYQAKSYLSATKRISNKLLGLVLLHLVASLVAAVRFTDLWSTSPFYSLTLAVFPLLLFLLLVKFPLIIDIAYAFTINAYRWERDMFFPGEARRLRIYIKRYILALSLIAAIRSLIVVLLWVFIPLESIPWLQNKINIFLFVYFFLEVGSAIIDIRYSWLAISPGREGS